MGVSVTDVAQCVKGVEVVGLVCVLCRMRLEVTVDSECRI